MGNSSQVAAAGLAGLRLRRPGGDTRPADGEVRPKGVKEEVRVVTLMMMKRMIMG